MKSLSLKFGFFTFVFFIGLILCIPCHTQAQDYCSINPFSETYYSKKVPYYNDRTEIVAARYRPSKILDSAMEYRSFLSMRSYRMNERPDSDPSTCDYYFGSSWVGKKIVIDSSGWDYYYNDSLEKISIHRAARLNDTFLMYTYPSGEEIHAVVTSHYWDKIFGKDQMIKVLTLTSDKAGFPNDKIKFHLSQYHGWLKWFEPAHFPRNINDKFDSYLTLAGLLNDSLKVGVTRLTWGDVYDFKPGDDFTRSFGYGMPDITNLFISKRNDIPSEDAVLFEAVKRRTYYGKNPDGTNKLIIDTSIAKLRYDQLSTFVTPYLPGELLPISTGHHYNWYTAPHGHKMYHVKCNNYEYSTHHLYDQVGPGAALEIVSDDCIIYQIFFGPMDEFGLGTYGAGMGNIQSGKHRMTRFHKKGTNCGIPSSLSVEEIEEKNEVFPNPSTGIFNIDVKGVRQVWVYSIEGKEVFNFNFADGQLDISDAKDGVYHVLLQKDKNIIRHRIVKVSP